jgi:hypothetical protein
VAANLEVSETRAGPMMMASDHRGPILLFLLMALLAWWANSLEPHVSSDHINIATMVLKGQQPELFSRDLGFSDEGTFRFYTPAYRKLIAFLATSTGDLLTAPRILTPILVSIYLCGAYLLFFVLTQHKRASLLTAILSLPAWPTLIDSWGLDVPKNMLPRSVFLAFVPWLTLGLIRTSHRFVSTALAFLAIGLLANLHPVSGFGFAQILLLTILFQNKFRPHAFARCAFFGIAAALPVIGFAVTYVSGTQVAEANGVPYTITLDLLKYRIAGFFPFAQDRVIDTLTGLAVPAVLAFLGWRLRRKSGKLDSRDLWFIWFSISTIIVSFGGTALIQLISLATESKPLVFDQMRTLRFIYLPLFAFAAYFVAHLLDEAKGMDGAWLRRSIIIAIAGFCVVASFPNGTVLHRLWNQWIHSKPSFGSDAALKSLGEWIRVHTPANALIDYDSPHLRFISRRSLVFCKKDGGILLYSGNERLREWHQRFLEEKDIPKGASASRLTFARKYSADYVVLEADWPPLSSPPVYRNTHFALYAVAAFP